MWRRKGKKKEKRTTFVACVAVSLKLVVLYYACRAFVLRLWGGKLVVFVLHLCGGKFVVLLPVWRQACGFIMPVWRYAPINVKPAVGGGQGMGWGFDCLCCPRGRAFD